MALLFACEQGIPGTDSLDTVNVLAGGFFVGHKGWRSLQLRPRGAGKFCYCGYQPSTVSAGYRAFWGHPVPDRMHPQTGRTGLRGAAVGTLVLSRCPGRPAINPFAAEVAASCRISEYLLRYRGIELKVVCVAVDAAAENNWLMGQALDRVQPSRVPALIGGDFNDDPCLQPLWPVFQQAGYVELGAFAKAAFALDLPNTCKSATRFDTMLVQQVLLPFIVHADVLSSAHIFDSHAPMRLHLRLPGEAPPLTTWRLPQSWTSSAVGAERFSANYGVKAAPVRLAWEHSDDMDGKLRSWSAVVEDAVSHSLEPGVGDTGVRPPSVTSQIPFRNFAKSPLRCPEQAGMVTRSPVLKPPRSLLDRVYGRLDGC